MPKYILSVDGGGIRGIIPAILLAEIEKRSQKPIAQIFDLMAGSSTGGFVAAAMCIKDANGHPKYTANDLVRFYETQGSQIFAASTWKKYYFWLHGPRYSHEFLEKTLNEIFGDTTMAKTSKPLFWKKDRSNIKVKEALRASSAAPTYFAPMKFAYGARTKVLVDGGVMANNPGTCAFASALRYFPNEELFIVSIGIGRTNKSWLYKEIKSTGVIAWIHPLLEIIFNSSLDCVDYHLKQILGESYIRLQTELKIASPDMDDASLENLKNLKQEAKSIIEQNHDLIEKFCAKFRPT